MKEEQLSNPWEISGITLPQKPRLAPWVHIIDLGDQRLQIRSAELSFSLPHKLFVTAFQAIQPLLDGYHDLNLIESSGGENLKPTTIRYLLKILSSHGVLLEGMEVHELPLPEKEISGLQSQFDFWSHFFSDGNQPLAIICKTRIGLVGNGNLIRGINESLRSIGFRNIDQLEWVGTPNDQETLTRHFGGVDYLIACQASSNPKFYDLINDYCLKSSTRWIKVNIEGTTGLLGPTIIPYQTACYKCYERRIASNMQDLEDYDIFQKTLAEVNGSVSEGSLPPLESILSNQVVLELARILTSFAPPQTIGRFYEISGTTLSSKAHPVLRVPRCPACRPPSPDREIWDSLTS